MRRKTAIAGFSYLAGVFFASFLSFEISYALAAAVMVTAAVASLVKLKHRNYFLLVVISLAVGLSVYGTYIVLDYSRAVSYDGKTGDFSGEITDYRYISNDVMLVTAKGRIENTKATVNVFLPFESCDYYDEISFTAEYSKIENTIEFDNAEYNNSNGIYLNANKASDIKITDGGFSLLKSIRNYSDYLFETIRKYLPHDEGAFIGAMLCGDRTDIDNSISINLNRAGIGHILSVSGTHLVIVTFVVKYVLELFKLSKKPKFVLTEIFITGFAVFAGLSSSVLRAAIMMTLINLSAMFKRKPDSMTTLAICGILLTVFTPYKIRSASFLLSMCGAFSLSVVSPCVIKAVNCKWRFKRTVNSFLSMCTVWVCSLPLCVMFFNQISVVSPVLNMLLVPICTAALVLGVITAFVAPVGFLAEALLKAAGFLISIVLKICDVVGDFHFSYIPLGYSFVKIAVIASLVLVLTALVVKRNTVAVIKCTVASLCCLMLFSAGYIFFNRNTTEIYVLNYEKSCAMVLKKNRKAVIIDKNGESVDACVRLLESKGITEVEGVFTFENTESVRAAYNKALVFCEFDSDNCYDAKSVFDFAFYDCEISFQDESVLVSDDGVTAQLGFTEAGFSEDSDVKIKAGENLLWFEDNETSSEIFDKKGIIIRFELKDNDRIGRFDYAIG